MAHPYLEREARFIALMRAIAPLPAGADPQTDRAARADAYAAAGLAPVADDEDAETCRRRDRYARHVRIDEFGPPIVPPPLAPSLPEVADA